MAGLNRSSLGYPVSIFLQLRASELRWPYFYNGSKDRLIAEGVIDPSFMPFAYSNGNYDNRILEMVKETGYSLAVTTRRGWIHDPSRKNSYKLNRVGIHQDIASTEEMFFCRILEIF